jgi:PAS domain S-box-containing protein
VAEPRDRRRFPLLALLLLAVGVVVVLAVSAPLGLLAVRATDVASGDAHRRLARQGEAVAGLLARALADEMRLIEVVAGLEERALSRSANDARARAESDPRRRAMLQQLQQLAPELLWAGFVSVDGRVAVATGELLEGTSVADRPWFARSMSGPHVGTVHDAALLARWLPSTGNGEPARLLDLGVPIVVRDRVVGVLAAHLDSAWLERVLADAARASDQAGGAHWAIVEASGRLAAGPSWLRGRNLDTDRMGEALGASVVLPDGTAGHAIGVPLPAGLPRDRLGWRIVGIGRTDVAHAVGSRIALDAAVLAGASCAIAVLLLALIATRLHAPLARLAAAVGVLARGGPWIDPGPSRVVEVDDIGRALTAVTGQAEAATDEARRLGREFESMFAASPTGLATMDTGLRFVRINDALAAINGLPVEAHIGRRLTELLPRSLAAQVEALVRGVIDTGRPVRGIEFDAALPSRPGLVRRWRVDYVPGFDERGRVAAVHGYVRDVTGLRLVERLEGTDAADASEDGLRRGP